MSETTTSLIIFAIVFGAALLGMILQRVLPERHLTEDSRKAVTVGIGLIATLTALVLGLLVGSVKGSFDAQNDVLRRIAANVVLLDRVMAQYGPETKDARAQLRQMLLLKLAASGKGLQDLQDIDESNQATLGFERMQDMLRRLPTTDPVQSQLQVRAVQVSQDIAQMRWLLMESSGSSIPGPFLVMLVFWLGVIFMSFGLFSPTNGTVLAVLFVCAMSVTGAIFLILEMDSPLAGMVRLSDAPLVNAAKRLGP